MPTTVVLDASFVLALFVPHPKGLAAQAIVEQLSETDITMIAPTLWLYEVGSAIQKLTYFKQITTIQAERAFGFAEQFNITLIPPNFLFARSAMAWSQRLKRASAYDSFYLALAQEHSCDLWTADSQLANAVGESWIRLLA